MKHPDRHLRAFVLAPIVMGMAFMLRNRPMSWLQFSAGFLWLSIALASFFAERRHKKNPPSQP